MANRPAKAGTRRAPRGTTAPSAVPGDDARPAVHGHRAGSGKAGGSGKAAGPGRAGRAADAAGRPAAAAVPHLTWLPYLVVLAAVAGGLAVVWRRPHGAAWGSAVVGCSLLAAAIARLALPPWLAGLLSSRGKACDVLAFTALGAGVLAVALMLP